MTIVTLEDAVWKYLQISAGSTNCPETPKAVTTCLSNFFVVMIIFIILFRVDTCWYLVHFAIFCHGISDLVVHVLLGWFWREYICYIWSIGNICKDRNSNITYLLHDLVLCIFLNVNKNDSSYCTMQYFASINYVCFV